MEVDEKEESSPAFAKSSMSVLELNNYIVSLRSTVKRARLQVIQKLVRKVKMYTSKKGSEEQVIANNKKAERFLEEIKLLKKIDIDKVSKYSLGNKLTIEQASLNERVYARVACHKSVQSKVMKWREEHDDWESLAGFAWSKITGRRFKKKKHDTTESTPSTETEMVEVTKLKEFVGRATCNDGDSIDSDQKPKDNNPDKIVSNSIQDDRSPQKLSNKSDAVVSKASTSCPVEIVNEKLVKSTKSKKNAAEVVVKQITLDQLSDEELFLPPLDNNEDSEPEGSSSIADNETRTEDDFFAAANENESDESEDQITNTLPEVESDEEESPLYSQQSVVGRAKLVKRHSSLKERKVYGSTSYEHRKSGGIKSYAEKRNNFSNKEYTKGNSRFPSVRSDSYPKKFSGKAPSKDKFNRKEFGYKSDRPNSNKFTSNSYGDRFQKKPYKSEPMPSKKPQADEHLHPSWEASRRKKEQQKNLFSFQGTKKVFADDDD